MMDEIELIANADADRRRRDALRKRKQRADRGAVSTTEYTPRSTCTTVPRQIRLRPDQWAAVNPAAARAGLNVSGWFMELVDDTLGLSAPDEPAT